jgi:hypothetical protein
MTFRDEPEMLPTLQARFELLEAQRASLQARFASVEPTLWVSHPEQAGWSLSAGLSSLFLRRMLGVSLPAQRAWSLSQIAHHLVLGEREVLQQLRSQNNLPNLRRSLRDRLGAATVGMAFRYGFRVRTPMQSVIPRNGLSYEEISVAWDETRAKLAAYLSEVIEASYDRLVFRHPVAGWMNIEQTLDLMRQHITHHMRQVERTEISLGIENRGGENHKDTENTKKR